MARAEACARLQADVQQPTAAASYRLTRLNGDFMLATRLPAGWQNMYLFGLDAQLPADYEMANWYTSSHPQIWFTKSLLVQRLTDAARYTLSNARLVERRRDGQVVERTASTAAQFAALLDEVFNLSPPGSAEVVFARLPAG